jgi:hypothetical protein
VTRCRLGSRYVAVELVVIQSFIDMGTIDESFTPLPFRRRCIRLLTSFGGAAS